VRRSAFHVAWYRLRATFNHRWRGYLAVALLLALVGGVAMGALIGARRTLSAFPTYLAASDSSNLQADIWNLGESLNGPATRNVATQLARLSDVSHVASAPTMIIVPLGPDGKPPSTASAIYGSEVNIFGSTGGMYFHQDRVGVAQGRLADPRRADEMDATAQAASIMHWHVGQKITFGAFTPAQVQSATFRPSASNDKGHFTVRLVGIIVFATQVAHDEVDRFPTGVLVTPALTARFATSGTLPLYGLRLKDGDRGVTKVENEIIRMLPKSTVYAFHETSVVTGQVQRASEPESLALGVFGAIAALAALLIAGLTISRQLWAETENLRVLRSLGADSATIALDAALGLVAAVILGAVLAAALAVMLTPLTLVGPVRQIEPSPGFAFDWTVLAVGLAVLVLGLGAATYALAYRRAAATIGVRDEALERRSSVVDAAARSGLAVAALIGLRFSLQRGRGRTTVPVRSMLTGSVLAVVVVVATVTFSSGLRTLNANPALYGWNWNLAIATPAGGSVPPIAGRLLDHDPDVASWTGFSFGDSQIDGQTVPELDGGSHPALSPPILSGHGIEAKNQVVVGAATLAALHKKIGDTVYFSYGSPHDAPIYVAPTPLVIVGTATFPAIGTSGTLHPSMGTGLLFSTNFGGAAFQKATTSPDPNLNGWAIDVVRLKKGVSTAAGLASLRRISNAANKVLNADPNAQGDETFVEGAQKPAEILAYQSAGATPFLLAAGLSLGAVVTLALALAASIRRRRRDLALLKALGFTQRQLATAVSWQASVNAVVGVVLGVPLGILFGRWLWTLFARRIYAVPDATVPVLQVLLIALGAIVVANAVAVLPARSAARTPTALILRAE
jgi:hypothetical protein